MQTAWDRVSTDPELLAEVRRRYRGRGDPADELWWDAHPGQVAPSGAMDPAEVLDAARRDLYRPGAGAGASTALAASRAARQTDHALALEAFADADAALRSAVVLEPQRARLAPVERRVVVALVAALAVGIVIGVLAGSDRSAPGEAATAVFARPQHDLDRVEVAGFADLVDPRTTRMVRSLSSIGTVVYAARATRGRVCLIAVVLGTTASAACTTSAAFDRGGVALVVQADADPVDGAGRVPSWNIELRWSRDGSVRAVPLE